MKTKYSFRYVASVAAITAFASTGCLRLNFLGDAQSQTETPLLVLLSPEDNNRPIVLSNEAAYVFSGTCTVNGGSIAVTLGGSVLGSSSCAADGTFSFTVDFSSFADGAQALTIAQTNILGETSSTVRTLQKFSAFCADPTNSGASPFAGGTGAVGDPYLICTTTQFANIIPNASGGVYFRLLNNLDYGGGPAPYFNGVNSLGNNHFDGFNLKISNFVVEDCMFGQLSGSGSITNLVIENATLNLVNHTFLPNGLLVFLADGTTTIDNIEMINGRFRIGHNNAGPHYSGLGMIAGEMATSAALTNSTLEVDIDGLGLEPDSMGTGGRHSVIGGAVGVATTSSRIENVSVSGRISADGQSGGVVARVGISAGVHNITVRNVSSDVHLLIDHSSSGGVIGWTRGDLGSNHIIEDLHFTGHLEFIGGALLEPDFGGIAGVMERGSLSECSVTGQITAPGMEFVGGLVGGLRNDASISECYSTADVSARAYVGGLVGNIFSAATISDSYSLGDVEATLEDAGGIVGLDNFGAATGTLTRVYAFGTVTAPTDAFPIGPAGAITCASDCYYNSTANPTPNGIPGTPLTETQMQSISNFGGIDGNPTWKTDTSISPYPVLNWQ